MNGPRWRDRFPDVVVIALALCVIALAALVLAPFVTAIAWACLLAFLSWPLHCRVRRAMPLRPALSAAFSTLLVVGAVIVPLLWLALLLAHALTDSFGSLSAVLDVLVGKPADTRVTAGALPAWVEELMRPYAQDRAALLRRAFELAQRWRSELLALLGGVGRWVGDLLTMSLALYFIYRDGDSLLAQIGRVRQRYLGPLGERCLITGGQILHGVMYGFLVTAAIQGAIAGLGYWLLGLPGAVLLGVVTGVASILPFIGTGLVWGSAALWLAVTGRTAAAILMLIWGALLVHPTDNLLRPILISSATRVPFLIILFGVFGGLAAFGLIGMFAGPLVLGMAAELWKALATDEPAPSGC